jgi:hypothetical protein
MDRTALLRTTYRVNSAATLACGVLLLAGGTLLAPLVAVPAPALWAMGAFFVLFATWIFAISRRAALSWSEALAAGALDGAYALASVAALLSGWEHMPVVLRAAIALVAAPVALFAAVELSSAQRLRGAVAAA